MANLNHVFHEYNKAIRLPEAKRNELLIVRDSLRKRISNGYRVLSERFTHQHQMEFQSQGSFVMDTIIRPLHDDYDLDDGLYFIGSLDRETRPTPAEFHKWVCQALGTSHDDIQKVVDKNACVRVQYKVGFHIDIPIYYADNVESPDLADKAKGWILSHPIEFIVWFEKIIASGFQKQFLLDSKMYSQFERWTTDIRQADHQLRRIVRYLKAWADLRREDMPCGIIMTILAANNYYSHDRDDIALKETLVNIQATLQKEFKCERPTTPAGEDLFVGYKNKDAFMKYLGYFIDNAKRALEEPNEKDSCAYWQRSLGDRFPCQIVKDKVQVNDVTEALAGGTLGKKPWTKI